MVASPARLDLRSLAVLRIALAFTLLTDLWIRWGDAGAHYGPNGVGLCRSLAGVTRHLRPDLFPCADQLVDWILVHFAVHAGAALCLLVGFRTRIANLVAWVLLVSLHNRNGLVLNGGDTLLRSFLFWSMFLPLGERWSADSRRVHDRIERSSVHSAATWIFVAQLLIVYPVATWYRRAEPAWWDGSALARILEHDLYATRLAVALRDFPELLTACGYAAAALESFGWALALVPVFGNGVLRTLIVLAFVTFHAAIAATMGVGMFPMVSAAGWLALLPSPFWDRVAPASRGFDAAPAVETVVVLVRRYSGQALLVGMAAILVAWNLARAKLPELSGVVPPRAVTIGRLLRMEQSWRLFPRVPKDDGWFVLDAELANGEHVDLLNEGAPTTLAAPDHVLGRIPNRRWGKLLMHLRERKHVERRAEFVRFYSDHFNASSPCGRQIRRARLLFIPERTMTPRPLWHQLRPATPAEGCAGTASGRPNRPS